ncbi:MAG: ATP-binding cassette domain-containing protein [Bacteroidota bacterium]
MVEYAVETERLSRSYGDVCAVEDVDLAVPTGSVYGFLGPNGAGKTTTLRLLLGLVRPDAGVIRIFGDPFTPHSRADLLARVGALIEEPSLYPGLTGTENLEATRVLRGLPRSTVGRALEIVGLAPSDAARRVRTYSQGMRQRLGLALALLPRPALLVLDEPANGLDPDGLQDLRDVLVRLREEGQTTVLVSSHQLGEVERVATAVGVMRGGRLVRQGPLADLLRQTQAPVRVRVSDPDRAAAALVECGIEATPRGETVVVEPTRPAEAGPDARVARIVRIVVEAGVDVFEVAPEAVSLESFFFASAAGAASHP